MKVKVVLQLLAPSPPLRLPLFAHPPMYFCSFYLHFLLLHLFLPRARWLLGWLVTASIFFRIAMMVTDLAMIDHKDKDYLTAASAAAIWMSITSAFLYRSFGGSLNSLCAQAFGAGSFRLVGLWVVFQYIRGSVRYHQLVVYRSLVRADADRSPYRCPSRHFRSLESSLALPFPMERDAAALFPKRSTLRNQPWL